MNDPTDGTEDRRSYSERVAYGRMFATHGGAVKKTRLKSVKRVTKETAMKRKRARVDYFAALVEFLEAALASKRVRNRNMILICVPHMPLRKGRRKPAMRATKRQVKKPMKKIRGGGSVVDS